MAPWFDHTWTDLERSESSRAVSSLFAPVFYPDMPDIEQFDAEMIAGRTYKGVFEYMDRYYVRSEPEVCGVCLIIDADESHKFLPLKIIRNSTTNTFDLEDSHGNAFSRDKLCVDMQEKYPANEGHLGVFMISRFNPEVGD